MRGRRVRRAVSDVAETVIPFAAGARNSVLHGKALLFGVFAALPAVVAAASLFRADMPPVAANSTLKCYDSAGNYEPCVTRASAPASRLNGRTTRPPQIASWTRAALYQQASWATGTRDQPESWATTALDQPANSTSASAARRSATPGKRSASVVCRRRLIPCFFSALRRGFTHIVSVAAAVGQGRPAREHL
jgi:hypothetical protein